MSTRVVSGARIRRAPPPDPPPPRAARGRSRGARGRRGRCGRRRPGPRPRRPPLQRPGGRGQRPAASRRDRAHVLPPGPRDRRRSHRGGPLGRGARGQAGAGRRRRPPAAEPHGRTGGPLHGPVACDLERRPPHRRDVRVHGPHRGQQHLPARVPPPSARTPTTAAGRAPAPTGPPTTATRSGGLWSSPGSPAPSSASCGSSTAAEQVRRHEHVAHRTCRTDGAGRSRRRLAASSPRRPGGRGDRAGRARRVRRPSTRRRAVRSGARPARRGSARPRRDPAWLRAAYDVGAA